MSICDDKEYFTDEFENIDDILDSIVYEDASMSNRCIGSMKIAFVHLIKYEIIRYKQDTDWIGSIKRVIRNKCGVEFLSNNDIKIITRNIDDIYKNARKNAKTELVSKGYKEANFVCPIIRPDYYNLDFISNESKIDDYLKSISLTREVRDYYGLSSKLTKEEENIMYNRMSLDKAFPKK